MSQVRTSLAVLLITSAWFTVAAPRVEKLLVHDQEEVPKASLGAVRHAVKVAGTADPQRQVWDRQVRDLRRAEENAFREIATTLDDDQREAGLRLQTHLSAIREQSTANAEVVALARSLIEAYGYAVLPPPEVTQRYPWRGPDQRLQVRAVIALTREGLLEPAQASRILGTTLALLEIQTAKEEAVGALRASLPQGSIR